MCCEGMKDGQRITFHGEGDQEPGLEPGDVIIVLEQKEHAVFHRQDKDLVMKTNIKLVEALCGFKRTVETLDNRMIIISSESGNCLTQLVCFLSFGEQCHFKFHEHLFSSTGEVIKHGDVKCVQNEGMPIYKNPHEKGQLIIQFQVRLFKTFQQ